MGNVRLWIRRHPWSVAVAGALVVAVTAVGVAAARSRPQGGCEAAPPVPDLPSQLRSIGGFDAPFDASDTRGLQDAAQRAASALHSDLGQLTFGDPVAVGAGRADLHDALVVPLLTNPGPDGRYRNVAGLVAFLRACGGQLYYHDVADLQAAPPPAFPSVPEAAAAQRLGGPVALLWTDSPFAPEWRRTGSDTCVAATPEPVAGCSPAPAAAGSGP